MKKLFSCIVLLLAFAAVESFAQEFNSSAFFNAETLLQDGLLKNEKEFSEAAAGLSALEKEVLYVSYKKDATLPFCLNFFAGYGIGSFLQGDKKTGVTALVGDLAGDVLSVSGYVTAKSVLSKYELAVATGETFDWEQNAAPVIVGGSLVLCGLAVKAGFTVYSSIRAFRYAEEYNGTLKKCLESNRADSSLTIAPVMDLSNKGCGFVASIKL